MKYIFIILSLIFVIGSIAFAFLTIRVRRNAHKRYIQKLSEDPVRVPVAHAGNEDGATPVHPEESIGGLSMIEFKNSCGEIMNPKDYDLFIVEGECMQYVNIHDKNLVFATKGFDFKSYKGEMPIVLVMKRTTASPDTPQYKLRRSWRFCEYTSEPGKLEEVVKAIMNTSEFQEIRNRKTYDSDDEMVSDFRDRLKGFEAKYIKNREGAEAYKDIVLSTTYHTAAEKTRFSIHPVSNIVGKVEGAFKLPKECIL